MFLIVKPKVKVLKNMQFEALLINVIGAERGHFVILSKKIAPPLQLTIRYIKMDEGVHLDKDRYTVKIESYSLIKI